MAGVGERLLGKYVVERELGRGGMGYVVAARHVELDELVAIKMVLPEQAASEEVVRRFLREARAAARIANEHVVRVSDVGRLPSGEPYMVMEMLEGVDLQQFAAESGPLPVADAIDFVMQALEAIGEAHAAGIVHRDLKPANLFLTRRRSGAPFIKVLDFGISKLTGTDATAGPAMTQTQGLLGSPLYMSPEQLESAREVDHRTDIWALGVILFQLLVKRFPFDADSLPQLVLRVMSARPESLRALRPDIPAELDAVVQRCLAKQRDDRFPDVVALAHALAPFGGASSQTSLRFLSELAAAGPVVGARSPMVSIPPESASSPAAFTASPNSAPLAPLFAGSLGTLSALGKTLDDKTLAPRRGGRTAALALGSVVVLGVAVFGVARVVGSRGGGAAAVAQAGSAMSTSTTTSASAPASAALATSSVSTVASASPSAPASASATASALPAPSASAPATIAAKGAPLAKQPAKSGAAQPVTAPQGAVAPASCEPPFYFDANQVKHFKPECMK